MKKPEYELIYNNERLELHCRGGSRTARVKLPTKIGLEQVGKFNPIYVDFLHGKSAHRRKYGGGKNQLIARAVGATYGSPTKQPLHVLDVTAGLGQDAFVLACLGCKVHMLERSPIIGALLEDGLKRAKTDLEFKDIVLTLTITDAIEYLKITKTQYDVIYLDPMFPARTKSALVKKEMRILREIVGEDLDAKELLKLALTKAKRVVVKRPRLAPIIPGPEPTLKFTGKSSRFDVYLR